MVNRIKKIVKKNKKIEHVLLKIYTKLCGVKKNDRGENNVLVNNGLVLKKCKIEFFGNDNIVIIGNKSKVKNVHIKIEGNNHKIEIGENCILNKSNLWVEDNNCKIIIGNKTTTEGVHFGAVENNSKIIIGEDCMFAHGIELITTDSHSIIDLNTNTRINRAKDIKIGNHVWIGAYVKILKGVAISDNTVVGTGTILSKSYKENNVIIAGVPGIIVRDKITWKRERV